MYWRAPLLYIVEVGCSYLLGHPNLFRGSGFLSVLERHCLLQETSSGSPSHEGEPNARPPLFFA